MLCRRLDRVGTSGVASLGEILERDVIGSSGSTSSVLDQEDGQQHRGQDRRGEGNGQDFIPGGVSGVGAVEAVTVQPASRGGPIGAIVQVGLHQDVRRNWGHLVRV